MEFPKPLIEGQFLKRYKRFFADINLGGETVTAHVPNTGSMKSCIAPQSPCLVSCSDDPKRALKFTLEAVQANGEWVGVNTGWPNKLAVELFKQKLVPHWSCFDAFQPEVKINAQSRMDLALWDTQQSPVQKWKAQDFAKTQPVHFVEVKNVTLKEGEAARFPDAVTERGQKHIQELTALIKRGFTAEMLFVVQRNDVSYFEPAGDIDPEYARLLQQAQGQGLRITAVCFAVNKSGIIMTRFLPIKFN